MDSTTEALTPKLNPMGLVITIVAGAISAGVMGFVYHLVANKAGIDYIIALALIMGAVIGFVVGYAARMSGLRLLLIVTIVAFVSGVAGYAARYFFEYNDQIESAVQEVAADAQAAGVTLDEVRAFFLDNLAQEYPPGGLFGYLQFVAESGFSIGSRAGRSDVWVAKLTSDGQWSGNQTWPQTAPGLRRPSPRCHQSPVHRGNGV